MSLTKDYTTKLRMALDRSLPAEARAFAVCECVFQPSTSAPSKSSATSSAPSPGASFSSHVFDVSTLTLNHHLKENQPMSKQEAISNAASAVKAHGLYACIDVAE